MSELAPAENKIPWVSFCMSTYTRPELLRKQLSNLLRQSFSDFEIIVSDNDPEKSAEVICAGFKDVRIKYYSNGENLGMIKSYNRSVERSNTEYVVMVTDDDPVEFDFLEIFYQLVQKNPGLSVYGGFGRVSKTPGAIEHIPPENFLIEILDPKKTNNMLWSSCLVNRTDLLSIGMLPDYGSPHLFDHAMLAMTGSIRGGLVINKMYSEYILHDQNFSKSNLQSYYISCTGFYETLISFCNKFSLPEQNRKTVKKHLENWFIVNFFSLKKYFTSPRNRDDAKLVALQNLSKDILALPYMRAVSLKFHLKSLIFFF